MKIRFPQICKKIIWMRDISLIIVYILIFLLSGCENNDDINTLHPPPDITIDEIRLASRNVMSLYRKSIIQEDIDRLQEILLTDNDREDKHLLFRMNSRKSAKNHVIKAKSFLDTISNDFRNLTILDLKLLEEDIIIDMNNPLSLSVIVMFIEVRSIEDPIQMEYRTHVTNSTFFLLGNTKNGATTFQIVEVIRDGPQYEIIIPGQVNAGEQTGITVHETTGMYPLDAVEIEVVDSESTPGKQSLLQDNGIFDGVFTPLLEANPEPLLIYLHRPNQVLVVPHRYRLRTPGKGFVEKIEGTDTVDFSAVTVAPNGTVWAGGRIPDDDDTDRTLVGGMIFQVSPGESRATLVSHLLLDLQNTHITLQNTRITDMVFDDLERLHVVLGPTQSQSNGAQPGVGVLLNLDQSDFNKIEFCQTVDVFQSPYPFSNPQGEPSPGTRAMAATDGDIWLFGSDGGVGRVADTQQNDACEKVTVTYDLSSTYRRDTHPMLPTNIVPALVVGSDGVLWLGTALGISRLQNGTFQTPFLFDPNGSVLDNPGTFERFFQHVVDAISDARPILSVSLEDLSFEAAFGRSLIKEDLIFSAIEERPRRLWFGTLGGGLRRIEVTPDGPKDTLLLTRAEGLGSNIIFALEEAKEGVVWASTEEGVSQVYTGEEPASFKITEQSLENLKSDGVLDDVLEALEEIKDQEFKGEEEFLDILKNTIGEERTDQHKSLILKHAKEPPPIINFSALDGLGTPVRDLAVDASGTIWLATAGGLFRIVQQSDLVRAE